VVKFPRRVSAFLCKWPVALHTRSGSMPITTLTTSPLCSCSFGLSSSISAAMSSSVCYHDPRCKQAGYDAECGIRELLLLLPLTATASSLDDNQ
jgi:hypothetical protein